MENNTYTQLNWNLVEDIYLNKYTHLRKIAYRRVFDVEMAEDIVQDTMESICKSVYKESKIYNIDAWTYTILKYKCIKVYRRKNSIQYFSNDVLEETLIQEELNTIEDINLYIALNELEKTDREIIIYKFIYGFKYNEISKICGYSYKTIKRKIDKSLEILRNKLLLKETIDI